LRLPGAGTRVAQPGDGHPLGHSALITGINISDAQIADARAMAPSCTFQVMNATKLDNRWSAHPKCLVILLIVPMYELIYSHDLHVT